jgi:hypothetical protein
MAVSVLLRAVKAFSTMLIALDGRALPPRSADAGKSTEYRP